MAPHGTSPSAATPGDDQARVLARNYSLLWQRNPQQLDAYLAQQGELSPAELTAVVRVDLRERWRQGERPTAEEYLKRYAQLATNEETAVDIIYAEFLAREARGERPSAAEFASRFPQFAAVLADQIQLHQAFDEAASAPTSTSTDEADGGLRADYEILDEIGRGGMGVVYRARQTGLNRLVALKMVRHADLANDELLARFRAEAEVVASLHHPHIVQVYDYGEHEGCPYLALELVEGGTLDDHLDGKPWQVRHAAQLVEQVARAVHFAHQHGVVHRDLKPNNLLVSADGDPPQVKIADFGLARIFRDRSDGQTQTGALLGTPSYMAPEQALGRQSEIGPATDVYGLGAILYELLCGRPPFRGESAIETLQQVLLAEPASIHRVAPGVPRDLATICSKCLERAPGRRYRTALALAEDLRRYLSDRPIEARPATKLERGWRWCRRNPALAGSLGSIAALLLTVSIVSTWYSGRLSRQLEITQRAELSEREANDAAQLRLWDAYLAEIAARNASRQMGQRFAALDTIERARKLLPAIGATDERKLQLRNAAIRSLALPDLKRVRSIWAGPQYTHSAAVALAAGRYALYVQETTLIVGDTNRGSVLASVRHDMPQSHVCISPDGEMAGLTGDNGIRIWRLQGDTLQPAWHDVSCDLLSFAPDGRHAVVRHKSEGLLVLNVENGKTVRKLLAQQSISLCCFHTDTNRLAVQVGTEVLIFDWMTGKLETRVPIGDLANVRMAWHPGGQALAVWGSSNPIRIWDLQTTKTVVTLPQRSFPQQLLFSEDGARLVSCGLWDSRLMLWDVGTGQKEFEVQGFDNLDMALDAGGKLTLIRRNQDRVEQWQLAAGAECRLLPTAWFPGTGTRSHCAISPDNRLLAISGERGLELWDLVSFERIARRPGSLCMAQFDRRGDLILAADLAINRWPRHDREYDGKKIVAFGPPVQLSDIGIPTSLATCIPDDRLVFETNNGWCALSLDGVRKRVNFDPPDDPRKSALSTDGRTAAIACWEYGGTTIWNTETGARLANLATGRWGLVEFSSDGRWLASSPSGVQIWRTSDWSLAHDLHAQGTTPHGLGIAFSQDSRVLAVGQTNGEVRFSDPTTGKDQARLLYPGAELSSLMAFTSDNRKLVSMSADENAQVRIWDLAEIRRSLKSFDLDWPAEVLASAPKSGDDETDIELEWNDAGWTLLKNAIRAFREETSPTD